MTHAGFPHSDINGSKLTSSSPSLFAGSRVLLRLLVPRHSLYALNNLKLRKIIFRFNKFFAFAIAVQHFCETTTEQKEHVIYNIQFSKNNLRVYL